MNETLIEIIRDQHTGTIQAMRCPAPLCGKIIPVTSQRLAPHSGDPYLTGPTRPCRLSGAQVEDLVPHSPLSAP
ncbi:hypothetical protein [Streptomyces sp. NPDC004296]|uniref:hypothetical protein n=1 Tax=Streptomyces sp. NPDC004296 TaxID=3364697 RepID=UPI003698AD30